MSTDADKDTASPNVSGIHDGSGVPALFSVDQSDTSKLQVQEKPKRRVCFPSEDQLVTKYFEPADPWHGVTPTSKSKLKEEYIESCARHNTTPIDTVIEQIQEFPESSLGGSSRAPRLLLSCCDLIGPPPVDALEAILRRVQFRRIQLEDVAIDDAAAEALFDMIEFYESAVILSISGQLGLGISGWQAATRMLKKSAELTELEVRECQLTPSHCAVLSRAIKAHTFTLTALCLQQAKLAGEPLLGLLIALKCAASIRELRLCDNALTVSDASQLAALLRARRELRLLDLSNNYIQDMGVGYIADALVDQAATSPNYCNDSCEPRGLSFLVLWNNQLTRNCAQHLSKILRHSTTLTVVNVGRNPIGGGWVSALPALHVSCLGLQGTALSQQCVMALADKLNGVQRIDLRDNRLSSASLQAILNAMQNNKTVTQIDLDDYNEQSTSLTSDSTETAQCSRLVASIRTLCRNNAANRENLPKRKISLTCHTTSSPTSGVCGSRRLRSPSPSPAASPVPPNNRFTVTRVSGGASPTTPTKAGGSRFTVMQVSEPPKIQVQPPTESSRKSSRFSVTRNYDRQYTPTPSPPPKPSPSPEPGPSPIREQLSQARDDHCTRKGDDSPRKDDLRINRDDSTPERCDISLIKEALSPNKDDFRLRDDLSPGRDELSPSPVNSTDGRFSPIVKANDTRYSLMSEISPIGCKELISESFSGKVSGECESFGSGKEIPTIKEVQDKSDSFNFTQTVVPKGGEKLVIEETKLVKNCVQVSPSEKIDVNVQVTVVKESKSCDVSVKTDACCVNTDTSDVKTDKCVNDDVKCVNNDVIDVNADKSVNIVTHSSDVVSLIQPGLYIAENVLTSNKPVCCKDDGVKTDVTYVNTVNNVNVDISSVKSEHCISDTICASTDSNVQHIVNITPSVSPDVNTSNVIPDVTKSPDQKARVNTMKQIEAITEDLGNLIQEMKELSTKTAVLTKRDTKNETNVDIDNIVPAIRDIVFRKNKSESSLDSPDLEVSRLMNKKLAENPFCDSSSSLEISGSSVESLDNTIKNELDRRRITSNESSLDEQAQNSGFLNISVSSADSVSPLFGKNVIEDPISSLEASISSLDLNRSEKMATSADSGIEYSLKHTLQSTLTSKACLKASELFQDAQETLTLSPKRTSSLLDVPALKKNSDRVRKISVVASASFNTPKIESEKSETKLPTHLEKLLSLFQHPASLFSRTSNDDEKKTSNTPPRKESSSLSSSFWSWGNIERSDKDDGSNEGNDKDDGSNDRNDRDDGSYDRSDIDDSTSPDDTFTETVNTESTLSERVQVSYVDESFSNKLDSKTSSTDTDNTLSEFHSLTEMDKKIDVAVTQTTDDGIVQNLDLSFNGNRLKEGECDTNVDLSEPNDLNKNIDKIVRPRTFAAVLKATSTENTDRQLSPDNGQSVDKLPTKVIRGIKENISPENTLTNTQTLLDITDVKTKKTEQNITKEQTTEVVDLGKDALSYLIYENRDFEPAETAEVEPNVDKGVNLSEELRDAELKKEFTDLSPELVIDEFPTTTKPIVAEWPKIKKSSSLESLKRLEMATPKDDSPKKPKNIAFDVPESCSTPRDIPKPRKLRSRSGSSPKSLPETFKQSSLPKMDHSFCKKKRKVSSLGKIAKDSLLALNMTEEEIQEFRRSYKIHSVESLSSLQSVSEDNNSQSGNSDRCRCLRLSQESLMSLDSITEDCKCNDVKESTHRKCL